ncbi:PRA1 family protein D-like isoform X1 [Durio zibethinus]|uniref:PRA1 family protein n=1 Tax=Durio zibethinus TaxID=66656 RepID=A0A6P5YGA2_DURZI|nr:PRA1 family protein D-like isoform X1 [Durio zibethinus]
MSTLISGLKETARSVTAIRRPWRDFLDITAFDFPFSFSDATTRIAQNLTHFRLNYTIILLLILFLSLIFHPLSLLTFLVILLAWFFLYFARDSQEQPVVIFGFTINDWLVIGALIGLTVAGLVLTGVWVNVLVAVAIGCSLVVLHAALRSTDDLLMDDLESPYGHVLAGGDEELDSPRGDYTVWIAKGES